MSVLARLGLVPTAGDDADRYDTEQPWIIWHFRTTDRATRILGRSIVDFECAVCGKRERLTIRMPRLGPVPLPPGGQHVERLQFKQAHLHRDKPHQMAWARPLLNPAAHAGGIDLDLLAMRLEADLRAAGAFDDEEAASV